MLSKVRPCHSVNVLTFPGCDRSVGGNGNGTDLCVCVCVYVRKRENVCKRMRPAYLAPGPVLDVCEGYVTELREETHVCIGRLTVHAQQRAL